MTPAELRAHAESEAKKFGPKCQRHGSDVVLALLDVAEAAVVVAAAEDYVEGSYGSPTGHDEDAMDRLRAALAKLETP